MNQCSLLIGNEAMLSKKTLKSRYEAESPDELALVKAVCNYGCRLLSRTSEYVSIFIPTQDKVTFKVCCDKWHKAVLDLQ